MRNIFYTFCIVLLFTTSLALAQTNSQNAFVNQVDQDLTVKSVTLAPVTDNVGGIYSRPLTESLKKVLNSDLQWSLLSFPENIKSNDVSQALKYSGADSVLVAQLTKGTRGINGTLTLFSGKDALPLIQETLTDYKGFDVADVNAEFTKMFTQLKLKMPYKGMILSRRGQEVTLNLGSNYGLKSGMNVTVVQIVKLNRHPKLDFMVSSEKEVLGRVQLTKVDKNLSFGSVVMEREVGVVAVGGKVLPEEFVKYQNPAVSPDGKILPGNAAFGDSPKEWVPEPPPQFGKVSLLAGISSYEQNTDIIGANSVTAKNGFAPNIAVRGELWIDSNWFVGFGLRQSIFAVSNDLNSSSPSRLNMSLEQYSVNGGYNFLLSNDFFGPRMQINAGFVSTRFTVDNSNPISLVSMQYGGMLLGLAGQFPISDTMPLDLGANFNLWLNPSLDENSSSGSSSNSVNTFGFFIDYRMKQRLNIKTELNFEYYKSDFSGTATRPNPATGTSHKLTTIMCGIEYMF